MSTELWTLRVVDNYWISELCPENCGHNSEKNMKKFWVLIIYIRVQVTNSYLILVIYIIT
jgi:hypothetical protein